MVERTRFLDRMLGFQSWCWRHAATIIPSSQRKADTCWHSSDKIAILGLGIFCIMSLMLVVCSHFADAFSLAFVVRHGTKDCIGVFT